MMRAHDDSREQLHAAVIDAIERAALEQSPVFLGREARELAKAHPDAGWSEGDILDQLTKEAIRHGLPVAFGV